MEYSDPIGQTCTKSERLGADVMIVMVCRPPYFTVNHTMTFSCFVLVEGSPSYTCVGVHEVESGAAEGTVIQAIKGLVCEEHDWKPTNIQINLYEVSC